MEHRYIMTAFGKDRPGVVADVSHLIFECGGNLEDSAMTRLEDEFAIILLFSVESENAGDILLKECRRLEREKGVSAFFRQVGGAGRSYDQDRAEHVLHVEGIDHTGIVYGVSSLLAEKNLNITNLSSKRLYSPESGTARYRMEIRVTVPDDLPLQTLRNQLAELADRLHVDILMEQKTVDS
jgi:glycine cleavage system transcriptional repressor